MLRLECRVRLVVVYLTLGTVVCAVRLGAAHNRTDVIIEENQRELSGPS